MADSSEIMGQYVFSNMWWYSHMWLCLSIPIASTAMPFVQHILPWNMDVTLWYTSIILAEVMFVLCIVLHKVVFLWTVRLSLFYQNCLFLLVVRFFCRQFWFQLKSTICSISCCNLWTGPVDSQHAYAGLADNIHTGGDSALGSCRSMTDKHSNRQKETCSSNTLSTYTLYTV